MINSLPHKLRLKPVLFLLGMACLTQCKTLVPEAQEFDAASRVATGRPVSVMLTSYSTTMLADGTSRTRLRVAITDSLSREITSVTDSIRVYVTGEGQLLNKKGRELSMRQDTAGMRYAECKMVGGSCELFFRAGSHPGKVKVEARSGKLWPGSHEIHLLPADLKLMKPASDQLQRTSKPIGRIIGADISFLPQIEAWGMKFYEKGEPVDPIRLLAGHGFNYIRLRIFVNPDNPKGYAPGQGFCDLKHTLDMAKRVRDAGMKLLLDFHYSDYWADPQQQYKPLAWENLGFPALKDSVTAYTSRVLLALKEQGTLPAMVQIGNEINHGILWPDGHIGNPDQLAELLKAGVDGVENVDQSLPVLMHIALGGQNEEAVFWLDNMIARGVKFDLIGLSYYPRWHGTLEDLKTNLMDIQKRYNKPLNVVEYSDFKREVHDIVFGLPDGSGTGACIWEPLNWRSGLFDQNGNATTLFSVYDSLNNQNFGGNQ